MFSLLSALVSRWVRTRPLSNPVSRCTPMLQCPTLLLVLGLPAVAALVPLSVWAAASGVSAAPAFVPAALQQPQGGWSGGAGSETEPLQPVDPGGPVVSAPVLSPDQAPPPPEWPLVVWDDFSDPDVAWFRGGPDEPVQGVQENGELRIQFEEKLPRGGSLFSVHQFRDFRADVDVQLMGDDPDVYAGLFLRYSGISEDRSRYYYWRIRRDAAYEIVKRERGKQTDLHESGPSACILSGADAVNHLTVVAQGEKLDFYANGCYLTGVIDDGFGEGDIGVSGGRRNTGGPVDVRFDNFRVYAAEPLRPVRFGEVRASLSTKDELLDRDEVISGLWPYPSESVDQFPSGTKRVELYVPFEGMTSRHQLSETALIDGELVWQEGPQPWGRLVVDKGHFGFGVYMRTFQMKLGGDLPEGHWDVRMYVDGTPVARKQFSVGAQDPAPAIERLEVGSAPAPATPNLPGADRSFQEIATLYGEARFDEALEHCAVAAATAPNSTDVLLESAKVYQAAGRQEWAQMLRSMAHNLVNNRVDSAVPLGDSAVAFASEASEALLREVPTGFTSDLQTEPERGDEGECLRRAREMYERSEYQNVVDVTNACLAAGAGTDEESLTDYRGRAFYFLGYPDRDEVLLGQAAAAFESVLALDPDNSDAYDYLGRIRYFLDDTEGAWDCLSQALALDPTLPSPHLFYARILYDRGDYEDAIPQFRAYLDHGGKKSANFTYTFIGWSEYKLKHYGPAEEAFLQASVLNQTADNTFGGLAWVYAETDRCAAAIPLFERAIELNPGFDGWKNGLARCQP